MKKPEKLQETETESVLATSVHRLPDGLWVARIYEIDSKGKATIKKESTPDLRAMAIERMQIDASNLFLS